MSFRKPLDNLDKEFPEDQINQYYKFGRDRIEKELSNFAKKALQEEHKDEYWNRWSQIRELLFHLNDRVNYWEGRRTQFLQIGIGLLAGSVAGILAIAANLPEIGQLATHGEIRPSWIFLTIDGIVYTFALIVCVFYAIGCLRLLRLWNIQNNPNYPFTKAYRTWVWHYRHAEEKPVDTDFQTYTSHSFQKQVESFSENLVTYKKRLLESEITELLDQDLSQAYFLLINEKFKIKMVSQLRDCLLATTRYSIYVGLPVLVVLSFVRCFLLI